VGIFKSLFSKKHMTPGQMQSTWKRKADEISQSRMDENEKSEKLTELRNDLIEAQQKAQDRAQNN